MIKLRQKDIFNDTGFHIGMNTLENEKSTFEHTHDFWELFIVKEGEVAHCINESTILVKKDELYLVKPKDRHFLKKGKCKKVQYVNVAFSEELFEQARNIYRMYGVDSGEEFPVMTCLSDNFAVSIQSKIAFLKGGRMHLTDIPVREVVLGILVDCLMALNHPAVNGKVPGWLENACNEMRKEENYIQGIERFVKLSGKTREYLARCMKKYYGYTPGQYLNSIRLEQAAALLETTDGTVLDIMLDCGFQNVSYFNQLFKTEYGVTPSRYRQVNRIIANPNG